MNKLGSVFIRVITIILTIGFVLSAVLSMFLISIDRRLLNASIYKSALVQQQIYNRLPAAIAQQLAMATKAESGNNGTGSPSSGTPAILQNLSADNWDSIVTSLAPPDILRSEVEGLIDQFFAYLNGEQDTVNLDLTPVKNRLVGSAGQDALLSLIHAQPACTLQQIAQYLASALSGQGLSICRPPDSLLTQAQPILQAALRQLAGQLPDSILLIPATSTQGSTSGSSPAQTLATAFHNARLIMRLSPDLPLVFLLLISLLAVRSPKNWLRWWGIPLCVTGLVGAIVVLFLSSSFEGIWNNNITTGLPSSLAPALIALGHDLLRSIFLGWLGGLLISCIFYCLLGLGLAIGSIFIHSNNHPDLPPGSQPSAA
jgi:hypothetical protein